MDHPAVRQDGHRPHDLGDEAVDLGRRHQPGEVGLRLQERLTAVGHQVIHVEGGLHRHRLQRLPQFLALPLVLGELPGNRFLGPRFNLRVGQQAGEIPDELVRFGDLALEPRRLAAVRLQRLARHRRDFVEHAVHIVEHGAHRILHAREQLVLAQRCAVVAGLWPVRLPMAAGVVAVRALGVRTLARVEDVAAAGAEQVAGEGADFLRLTRAIDPVGRKLRLGALERLFVDDAQRLVAVDDVAILVAPARHAPPRAAVELEASPEVADLTDQHAVRQDAADRPESPRPAKPCGHAARPHATRHFLQADGLGEVRLEDESHRLGFLFVDGKPFLSVLAGNDAIPIRRRAAGPAALAVALHESSPRALGQHAAVVGGDDELHAACEGVRPFGDAHHFDAVLLQILHKHVRLRRPAETVVLVDVELVDPAGFGFLHEAEKLRAAARRASGFRLVDEVLEGLARRALARLNLHGDARAFVLGVT